MFVHKGVFSYLGALFAFAVLLLAISPATVKRDWTVARAFLKRELAGGPMATDE